MNRLLKFIRLSSSDQRLLVKATMTLAMFRAALWLIPFGTLRRTTARLTQTRKDTTKKGQTVVDRTVWAVGVASRYVPRATCLTQALAAQLLLSRRGCPTHLHIGVAKKRGGDLEAHAWLESDGRVLIGGLSDLSRFTSFPPLDGEGP